MVRYSKTYVNQLARKAQRAASKAVIRPETPVPRLVAVPINPLTNRAARDIKTGQYVIWGVLDTKTRALKPLQAPNVQRFTKKEYRALTRSLSGKDKPDHVVYEEYGRRAAADESGHVKISPKTGAPVREIIQRFEQPTRTAWRPVLYTDGQRAHETAGSAIQERSKREMIEALNMAEQIDPALYAAPGNVRLEGATLKEAMAGFQVPITLGDWKREQIDRIEFKGTLNIEGVGRVSFSSAAANMNVTRLDQLSNAVAAVARHALAQAGASFTRFKDLKKFYAQAGRTYKKADAKFKKDYDRYNEIRDARDRASGAEKERLNRNLNALSRSLDQTFAQRQKADRYMGDFDRNEYKKMTNVQGRVVVESLNYEIIKKPE